MPRKIKEELQQEQNKHCCSTCHPGALDLGSTMKVKQEPESSSIKNERCCTPFHPGAAYLGSTMKVKQEPESSSIKNERCCSPFHPGASDLRSTMKLKHEPEGSSDSDDDVKFEEFRLKTEEIDVSDMEFPSESDSEKDYAPTQIVKIENLTVSDHEPSESAAPLPTLEDNSTPTEQSSSSSLESLCRPCVVLVNRLDLKAGANPAVVFSCSLCKFGFTSKIRRDRHQRLSCRLRRFDEPIRTALGVVELAPEKTPAALELGAKLSEPGPGKRKQLKCRECSYITDRDSHFRRHLVTHTGARSFACTQCEFKATQKASLAQHLLTHGDVKPFACTVCNYRSVQKGNLTVHMRLHTGDKPFKCTQCDYACKMRNDLANHVRGKHTKERPYACTQCELTFVTSSTLSRHIVIHTGVKKLSCSECTYKCNRSMDLKKHVAVKHQG